MTGPDGATDRRPPPDETATAAQGTAAPVDVEVDPRARNAVAVLLAGPIIAVLHFAVVYLVTEAGCTGDGPGLNAFDPPVPAVVTVVATAVAAVLCCATALWAHRRWQNAQTPESGELVDHEPMSFVGFLLSLLALVTVLLVGLPALVLEAC